MTANTTTTRRTATGFESGFGGRRCGRVTCTVADIVKVVGYCIVGIILVFLIVVDNGVGTDVGYGFVFLVDGRVLGVDISEVIGVVYINVAIPCVVVEGDAILFYRFIIRNYTNWSRIYIKYSIFSVRRGLCRQ